MKIYISGPITGTTDYMERFKRMQEALEGMGHTVINPAKVNAELPQGTTHEEYMTMCRPMIDMCEVVLMMEGWQQSKGCRMEFDYAMQKRITITFEGAGGNKKEDFLLIGRRVPHYVSMKETMERLTGAKTTF